MEQMESNLITTSSNIELQKWMNIEYFQELVDKDFKNYSIKSINISPAVSAGENYTSQMHRIKMNLMKISDGSVEEKLFISKSIPPEGSHLDILKFMNLFPKEITIYKEILPKFEEILSKSNINSRLAPKCFKVNSYPNPADIIVLKDLKPEGYKMMDRFKGLDMDHSKLLLKKLAEFHAASMVNYDINGPYDQQFADGMFSEKTKKVFEDQFFNQFLNRIDMMEEHWDFVKPYVQKMRQWNKDTYFVKLLSSITPVENGINVLNHGDLWTNNMLFLHDDYGKPIDVLLIDFQVSFWGSPGADLNYFMVTSFAVGNNITKFDELLETYHKHLIKILNNSNYKRKIPSFQELKDEVFRTGFYGCLASLRLLALILAPPQDIASFETSVSDSEEGRKFRLAMVKNPIYEKVMKTLLPIYDERKYFDV